VNRRQQQPHDARAALAQRREATAGGAASERSDVEKDARRQLDAMTAEFQAAMPRGREAVQLVRDAKTALSRNPDLALVDRDSLLGAFMTCAQLALRPNVPALGEAYVLPFWDRDKGHKVAQLVIGYQGLINLGMRTPVMRSIIARTVLDEDEFDVDYGVDERLVHRPAMFRKDYIEDPMHEPAAVAYYTIWRTTNGGYGYWVMSRAQVERHRQKHSKSPNSPAWRNHFDAMGRKTTIRQGAPYFPKSAELEVALQVDEGVRLNWSPDAKAEDVSQHIDGDWSEGPSGEQADAGERPPVGDWPSVATPPPS
jgi:recombination protein RecT